MPPALVSGLLMLAAIALASIGAFMIYTPAGYLTIAAGLAYMAWAVTRTGATP